MNKAIGGGGQKYEAESERFSERRTPKYYRKLRLMA